MIPSCMDVSLQASPLLSWRHDHRRLLAAETRLSSSQLGALARKLGHPRGYVRCSASESGGEAVDDKHGSKTATLEASDDVDSGSWLESEGKADPFSSWIFSGSQQAKASGWMTIGGVIVLTLGFALGARSLYSKRDVARQFMVGRPTTEERVHSFSKTEDVENTLQNADCNESAEVSERGEALEKAKQQHCQNDVIEVQAEEDGTQPPGSVQNMGSENHIVEESGIDGGPVSVSTLDNLGNTEKQLKSPEVDDPYSPEHTAIMDAAAATKGSLTREAAEGAEITERDGSSSFTYANENDINGLSDESDVSDKFFGEDSTFEKSFWPDEDLYEGLQGKTSDLEDDEQLTRSDYYAKTAFQKDFAHVKATRGYLPAAITAPSTPLEDSASSLGEVVVPAHANRMQEQILAALQELKVIEADVKAGDICTRREYARWLMTASVLLTRSAAHKVLPAMYIENVSVLAYEDVTPEDQDFPFIQGLAEAGLLSSKLVQEDHNDDVKAKSASIFCPDRHLFRQDLVTWRVALERKPAVMEGIPTGTELTALQDTFGFIDLDKVHKDALPALLTDMSAGEHSIVALTFGHTRRLQPQKLVTKGQAAVALATGAAWEFVSEELEVLQAESVAEAMVVAEMALEAKAMEEVGAAFEKLLQTEREKQKASASMIKSLQAELEQMKTAHEAEKLSLLRERAAVKAEQDLLFRARLEAEQQALALSMTKMEAAFQQEKTEKLLREAEEEESLISDLRSELEIEKHALILARSWAEDEARKAQELSRVLWKSQGNFFNVDTEITNIPEKVKSPNSSLQHTEETSMSELENVNDGSQVNNSLTEWILIKSKEVGVMLMDAFIQLYHFLQIMLHKIMQWAIDLYASAREMFYKTKTNCADKTAKTLEGLKQTVPASVAGLSSNVREVTLKTVDEWKGGAEKLSQKFKAS